jgi:hypothetical protein
MIILTCGTLGAKEIVFGDNFQRGTPEAYLENAKSLGNKVSFTAEKGVDGKVLKLTVPLSFKLVPVKDQTKYQLTFRARQQGVETIEDNPRLGELIFNCRSFLPWYRLKFYDANRKEIRTDLPVLSLPFGQWHEYVRMFYSPMNAAFMQLEVNTGSAKENTLWLANAKLASAPDEQSININPTFSYGHYNYSGWSSFNGVGRLHELEGDKTVLDTGFSATSASFPLREPGTYEIRLKATGNIRNYNVFLIFTGADGKEITRIGETVGKPRKISSSPYVEKISYFVLPKGAVRGYFLVYHSVLSEIRLTRVGDEGKYKELTKVKTK